MICPSPGSMVYWRFKVKAPCPWSFGYCTWVGTKLRMGRWNGDTTGGYIVSPEEIEWEKYKS